MHWIATLKNSFQTFKKSALNPFRLFWANAPEGEAEQINVLKRLLLQADFGPDFTRSFLEAARHERIFTAERSQEAKQTWMVSYLTSLLAHTNDPLARKKENQTSVVLFVGVNGAGKTTTLAKVAHRLKEQGQSVLVGAGDTFRAAAVSQLKMWCERIQVPVIAQPQGSDSSAVLFDGLQSARAKKSDFFLGDTAGRLNQPTLGEELKKIVRTLQKQDSTAPHHVFCIVDPTLGLNALQHVEFLNQHLKITGFILTKLDGTAKGGVIFALAQKYKTPIDYISFGETLGSFAPFDPRRFSEAFFESPSGWL